MSGWADTGRLRETRRSSGRSCSGPTAGGTSCCCRLLWRVLCDLGESLLLLSTSSSRHALGLGARLVGREFYATGTQLFRALLWISVTLAILAALPFVVDWGIAGKSQVSPSGCRRHRIFLGRGSYGELGRVSARARRCLAWIATLSLYVAWHSIGRVLWDDSGELVTSAPLMCRWRSCSFSSRWPRRSGLADRLGITGPLGAVAPQAG